MLSADFSNDGADQCLCGGIDLIHPQDALCWEVALGGFCMFLCIRAWFAFFAGALQMPRVSAHRLQPAKLFGVGQRRDSLLAINRGVCK